MEDGFISVSSSKKNTGSRGYQQHDTKANRAPPGHAPVSSGHHDGYGHGHNHGHNYNNNNNIGRRKYNQHVPNAEHVNTSNEGVELSPSYKNPFSNLAHVDSSSNASEEEHEPEQNSASKCLQVEEEEENEETILQMIEALGAGPHQLKSEWTFWFLQPPVGSKSNQTNYESLLKPLGTFSTIQDFWSIYLRLKRPKDLHDCGTTDYSLFHNNIRPVWEDSNNSSGGRLMFRVRKSGIASAKMWELLILALIGGELSSTLEEGICGLVFSIRPYEDIISVWTRHAHDMAHIQEVRDMFKRTLQLNESVPLEYKPHHYNPTQAAPQIDAEDNKELQV